MRSDGTVGIDEAARLCGVSDETIRRRLRAQRIDGAYREGGAVSAWRIPVGSLTGAGLEVQSPVPAPAADRGAGELAEARALAAERLARIEALERHVADLQRLLAVVEERGGGADGATLTGRAGGAR